MSTPYQKVEDKQALTIPYNFEPRHYQLPMFQALDEGYRYLMILWSRRHGKDKACFNAVVKEMMRRKANYGYIFPTSTLARDAAWNNIDKDGFRLLDHLPPRLIKRKLDNQMFIETINGSTLKFFGSDKQISVGTNYRGLVFSEFALQNPDAYLYLRPVITENKGFIILNSTTRGKNHLFDLWNIAKNNPKTWFTQKVTWKDAGILTQEDIDLEREGGVSDEMINSEYNCEFAGLEGSYYIRYIDKMRLEGRIGRVPYDPSCRVSTAWDLGTDKSSNSNPIIFFQKVGQEIHIIDSYSNSGMGLEHYASVLQGKPYVYDTHYAPHDIRNVELGTGLSRRDVASSLGIDFEVLPTLKIGLLDGIEIVRGMFQRVWIDEEKNKDLLSSLENYRHQHDKKSNIFINYPVHDRFSHFADAYRYTMIACKHYVSGQSGLSDEDFKMLNERNRRMR